MSAVRNQLSQALTRELSCNNGSPRAIAKVGNYEVTFYSCLGCHEPASGAMFFYWLEGMAREPRL